MTDGLNITLKQDADAPTHYFVKATSGEHPPFAARLPDACARKGCGMPPEHPVHLRPPGDAPPMRRAATG